MLSFTTRIMNIVSKKNVRCLSKNVVSFPQSDDNRPWLIVGVATAVLACCVLVFIMVWFFLLSLSPLSSLTCLLRLVADTDCKVLDVVMTPDPAQSGTFYLLLYAVVGPFIPNPSQQCATDSRFAAQAMDQRHRTIWHATICISPHATSSNS